MENSAFSVVELGNRLRRLRLRAGLTQQELASRFKDAGKLRRNTISRLEKGLLPNPSLVLIVLYLRACGARWNEIAEVFERADYLSVDSGLIEKCDLSPDDNVRVTRAVEDQLDDYQSRLRYRRNVPPVRPEHERPAAERFRNYRIVANIVELAVSDTMAVSEITILQIPKYRAVGRQVLGLLWRLVRTESGRCELASESSLPERLDRKLEAKTQEWQELGLDPELVQQVQVAVIEQFRSLLEKNPGLFPGEPQITQIAQIGVRSRRKGTANERQ